MKRGIFLAVLLVMALSGCAAAVLTGAATGDNAYPTTGEDARIARDVRTALYRDPVVGDERIAVAVAEGRVTLSGTVTNRLHIERAAQLAGEVAGVRGVDVELQVAVRP